MPTKIVVCTSAPLKLFSKNKRDKWSPSLSDINNNTYDYLKLNRVSGFIDGNTSPFPVMVGFDGSLALPATEEFTDKEHSLKIFNRIHLEMLLGGIYTEAVLPEDIGFGELNDETGYFRYLFLTGRNTSLHYTFRELTASVLERIKLIQTPTPVSVLSKAVLKGRNILEKCEPLSHEIILSGCSHYVRGAFAEALVCIWTGIEQLISRLWLIYIVEKVPQEGGPSRKELIKQNSGRNISQTIEILFHRKILIPRIYNDLTSIRRARNHLAHEGKQPSLEETNIALSTLFDLISYIFTDGKNSTANKKMFEHIKFKCIRRTDNEIPPPLENIKFWRNKTPLPGDPEFKGRYKAFKLDFSPINQIKKHPGTATKKIK